MSKVPSIAMDMRTVLVDPGGTPAVNCDFNTIHEAAAFLKALPTTEGGTIYLKGDVIHYLDSAPGDVDVRGLTLASSDGYSGATIQSTNGNRLRIAGTKFRDVILRIDAADAGTFLLDIFQNSYNTFNSVTLQIGAAKFILGTSLAGPFNAILIFQDSGQIPGAGQVIDPAANLNFPGSVVVAVGENGRGIMQFGAYPLSADPQARYETTGQITGIAPGALYCVPGESIQERLDSLSASGGGVATLLPGTFDITTSVSVPSNVALRGVSRWTCIIRALAGTWVGGVGAHDGAIMVGTADGNNPRMDSSVENLQVNVSADVHGIIVNGGEDISVENCVVKPLAAIPNSHCAICFTNGNGTAGRRFRCKGNIVTSDNAGAWYWTDGIHMDGGQVGGFTGIFGFATNNNIYDSICFDNIVEKMQETVFLFTRCIDSSIFVNRTRTCPYSATGIAAGLLACVECDLQTNSFVDNPSGGNPDCCYVYDSVRCKVLDNTADGIQTAGSNFNRIFWFTGSGGGGYSDQNHVAQNVLKNATVGVRFDSGSTNNRVGANDFTSVTTPYQDANATPNGQKFDSNSRRSNVNPSGVTTGVFGETIFETTGSVWYKCTSYPQGTAWQVI